MDRIKVTSEVDSVGRIVCEITDGEFAGCKFCYDSVGFNWKSGVPVLSFEYFIKNDFVIDPDAKDRFVTVLGDNLQDLITVYTNTQNTVFFGGTD